MVVLHDSGLYIRTVFITKCGTDIGCSCQHFLCMCKLPDGVIILVCICVSDSLDGRKHAHRGCVQEFDVCIVITCGGGGIPVVNDNGRLSGVNAVIDKDNASSLLAAELEADYLIILTAVEKVAINFGRENQEWLSDLTVDKAKEYIAQEQFAKGSMLPKIEAAIRFAQSGEGRRTLITLLDKAAEGIAGSTGTVIHK